MNSHLLPTYARVDLAFERGEGAWLFTAAGERYLDFTAGVAVNALGHAHPHLVKALTEQAHKVWHVSNLYRIPEGEKLADRLCAASFADTVFFQNSGAEALFGHRADDAVGQTLDLIVPLEYRERHWAGFHAALAAGDGKVDHAAANVPAMHRDGSVLRVAVRLLVIYDARDRPAGALAVFAPDDKAAPPLPRL